LQVLAREQAADKREADLDAREAAVAAREAAVAPAAEPETEKAAEPEAVVSFVFLSCSARSSHMRGAAHNFSLILFHSLSALLGLLDFTQMRGNKKLTQRK
jgi:hypothetical protein